MKTFKKFVIESYNPDHPDEDHHIAEFHRRIAKHYPNGVELYHEAPGHVGDSMKKHGIKGEYGIFARVGEPSNFVTSEKKTIVKFRLPPHSNNPDEITHDMPYDGHKDFLKRHPNIKGGDVSVNREVIHPRHIVDVKEVG